MPKLPEKDPNYLVKGIKLVVHYARLLEEQPNLYVQATMYHGKSIVNLSNAESANWITKEVEGDEVITVPANSDVEITKEGVQV